MQGASAIALGLALSAFAPAADPLPPSLDGVWDVSLAACVDQDSVTRLRIMGASLQYYEWGDEVLSARPDGEGSVSVDLAAWSIDDVDANDLPVIRRRTGKLSLSPDQSRLTVTVNGYEGQYVRCSS